MKNRPNFQASNADNGRYRSYLIIARIVTLRYDLIQYLYIFNNLVQLISNLNTSDSNINTVLYHEYKSEAVKAREF